MSLLGVGTDIVDPYSQASIRFNDQEHEGCGLLNLVEIDAVTHRWLPQQALIYNPAVVCCLVM